MTKCMKLDLMLLKPYLKSMLLVLIVPLIFPFVTQSIFEGLSFAVTVLAMTTAYTFSIAEKNGLERFYGFIPVRKSSLVLGRYLAVFGSGVIVILAEVLIQTALYSIVKAEVLPLAEIIKVTLLCLLLFSIYAGVQLPGYYKYGSIKGKALMFIPTAGFLGCFSLIRLLGDSAANMLTDIFSNVFLLSIIAAALMVIIVTVSASSSIRIVSQRPTQKR